MQSKRKRKREIPNGLTRHKNILAFCDGACLNSYARSPAHIAYLESC